MQAVLWPHRSHGVISHASALALHDLCDVNPAHIDITVPAGYRVTRVPPGIYRLHHHMLQPVDITHHEGIPVVTPRRAILDGIEAHIRHGLIEQAGYQIAQKLHACTECFMTGPDNDRFRDLMDLLLLRGLLTEADLARVRAACVRIFESATSIPGRRR